MMMHCFKLIVFGALTFWVAAPPASASGAASGEWRVVRNETFTTHHSPLTTHLFAEGWGFGRWFSGGGRTRVVQFCAATMCVALFIMMRKFQ